MEVVRTDEKCFEPFLGFFPYSPSFVYVNSFGLKGIEADKPDKLRMAIYDQGPRDGCVILLLHGEPTWSFLYRKMMNNLIQKGYRVIAIDLIGFGRSDKPIKQESYSYARHVSWLSESIISLKIEEITLFVQDWGGLLGLRVYAANPHLFAGVVAGNTFLPTGDHPASKAFLAWQKFSRENEKFDIGRIVKGGSLSEMEPLIIQAYNAPFPSPLYKAGARMFPSLVPTSKDNPESEPNRKAWKILQTLNKPFLCAFSDSDPVTQGGDKVFINSLVGCKNQDHVTVSNAGHFLQEDAPDNLSQIIHDFIVKNKIDKRSRNLSKL